MNISKFQDKPNVNWFSYSIKKNKNYSDVIKTFMGRDAINIFLFNCDKLFKKETKRVLLPAYTCTEVIDPFIEHGYEIVFYDIDNFRINIKEIDKILHNYKIDIFYFIHYFGIFHDGIQDVINLVKSKSENILIMEDRAHYLNEKKLLKNVDAIVYSFRKLLPIPEGGGLHTALKMKYEYKSHLLSNLLPIVMILKRIIIGYDPRFTRSGITKKSSRKKPTSSIFAPSLLSKRVIENYDIKKNTKFRRDLFRKWLEKTKKSSLVPVFEELNKDDIPQGFPIFINDARKTHEYMKKKGIYLKRHWPLAQEFEEVAPISYKLSNQVITLPIYEGINETDMDLIIKWLLAVPID